MCTSPMRRTRCAPICCHHMPLSHSSVAMARAEKGGWDSNEPPIPPAGSPLGLTLLFLYIIPNLILNDTHQHFATLVLWMHCFLVPSPSLPQRGGISRLPRLIDKPSAAVAATSRVAITFHNVLAPPSFPWVPTWPMASATCTVWGRQSGPKQALKVPSTLFLVLSFEEKNDCSKIGEGNGQLFNRCNRCNCNFCHQNVSLQVCQHQHAKQVLKGDIKLPEDILFLPRANRLARAGRQAFSDSR